uniref:Uncharacterized protein n=1 Tax=Sphaerodactylus townsendi TaxID=933632 RepID=A0ACB8G9X2_9SAUR
MIRGSRFHVLFFCITACWAAPILYEQGWASSSETLQYMLCLLEGQEQRIVLWALSLVGFYSLAWLLDDHPMEPCPIWKGAEVMNGKMSPARNPRHGCSVRSNLKSLEQVELNLVTLLYQLRKHKVALDSGSLRSRLSEEQNSGMAKEDLSKDLVIYTIQDEL